MGLTEHQLARRPDLIIDLFRGNSGSPTDRVFATLGSVVNASPVWARLLASDNGFSQLPTEMFGDSKISVLSLPEDDADAMLVLLRIMHYKNQTIPKSLTYSELLQIAIICDKYNCDNLVFPWARTWINGLLNDPYHEYRNYGHEGWLFIGTVFRSSSEALAPMIEALSAKLIMEICEWESQTAPSFVRKKDIDGDILDELKQVTVSTDMIPGVILGKYLSRLHVPDVN
ncbi:hypothetical protein AA313_de0201892 [Arthrobotrys entomopaga]|nr:hypothetical protein AA313_de0201892 [Arthrobotrys entomopaga]